MGLRLAALAVLLALSPHPTVAHEKFKIVGTVVKIHAEQIDVKAVDGATYEIDFLDSAPVTRKFEEGREDGTQSRRQGDCHALGHDMFDLEAVEVQLVD